MTTPVKRQFFLSEALMLTLAFGGFLGVLVQLFKVNVWSAFTIALIFTGLAGICFAWLWGRQPTEWPGRKVALIGCLALFFGMGSSVAPARSRAGESFVFKNFEIEPFIKDFASSKGVILKNISYSKDESRDSTTDFADIALTFEASETFVYEASQAFRMKVKGDIEKGGYRICGSGTMGVDGFSYKFEREHFRGFMWFQVVKKDEKSFTLHAMMVEINY